MKTSSIHYANSFRLLRLASPGEVDAVSWLTKTSSAINRVVMLCAVMQRLAMLKIDILALIIYDIYSKTESVRIV